MTHIDRLIQKATDQKEAAADQLASVYIMKMSREEDLLLIKADLWNQSTQTMRSEEREIKAAEADAAIEELKRKYPTKKNVPIFRGEVPE